MTKSAFPDFPLRFGRGFQQVFQFGHELLNVFEVEIDGGEAHIRDFVVPPQAVHDEFANLAGLALALGGFNHKSLGLIDNLLEPADRDGSLLARTHQAIEHFLAVKALAATVLLNHHLRDFGDALVCRKALFAL